MSFKAFRKIGQFKDAIKTIRLNAQFVGKDDEGRPIYDEKAELPILTFRGTVKLHGTNAGIEYDTDTDTVLPQKRTASLDGNSGHFGFVEHVKAYEDFYRHHAQAICHHLGIDRVYIFGEWCGQGVQKSVAISELEKRFVIFAAYNPDAQEYIDPEVIKDIRDHDKRCYNIYDYEQFEIKIDTRYPELAVEKINSFVDQVEKCCPASKAMLETEKPDDCKDREEYLGEGIVWICDDIMFKTKGEKHSKGGGKRATVDPLKAKNVKDFVDKVVTEDRLQQCWDVVSGEHGGELQMKNLGDLLKWLFNDILEEEGDALAFNDLTKKDVGSAVANTARPWFMNKVNSF